MPNKSPTESGKIQTAVLGKEAAHPSFGDRVWTSRYIFFKYPHIPVCTEAPARVRQYTFFYGHSIGFSISTVQVFWGSPTDRPFVGRGRVSAITPTLQSPHRFRMTGVPDRGISCGGARRQSRVYATGKKSQHGSPCS